MEVLSIADLRKLSGVHDDPPEEVRRCSAEA